MSFATCGDEAGEDVLHNELMVPADEGGDYARRYRDRVNNFSLVLPWEWTIHPTGNRGDRLNFVARSPLYDAHGKPLRITIGVVVIPLTEHTELNTYYEIGQEALKAKLPLAYVQETGLTSICDTPARWILFGYKSPQGNAVLLQYYFIAHEGRRAYAISVNSDEQHFNSYRPLLDSIVRSFREEYRY